MVTLLSKPNCQPCIASKRYLTSHGIQFEERDISKDPAALELAMSLGHSAAPVVISGDTSWSGFRPDLLASL